MPRCPILGWGKAGEGGRLAWHSWQIHDCVLQILERPAVLQWRREGRTLVAPSIVGLEKSEVKWRCRVLRERTLITVAVKELSLRVGLDDQKINDT